MKTLILVLDPLGSEADELLTNSTLPVSTNIKDLASATALIVRSSKVSREMILKAPCLKAIARAGVGLDSIDVEFAESQGIKVFNSAKGNTVNAAETTIGLILSLAHHIADAHLKLYGNKIWDRSIDTEGYEIQHKTLGIIGFGNVGSTVAQYAKVFGMHVKAFDPYTSAGVPGVVQLNSKQELLMSCDFVTLHTPLTPETQFMIDFPEFELMKPSSYLINASRGRTVREAALVDALINNKIKGAALDVFEEEPLNLNSPLYQCKNILMIPHLGGASREARKRVSCMAVEHILSFLKEL
ncbi:MAG: hydroxyacid dehydrogenase [Brevinemataceae bacterium]